MNFNTDLTLISDTPQLYVKLESVRLLEKTLAALGIEPVSHCLTARNFITIPTGPYRSLSTFSF